MNQTVLQKERVEELAEAYVGNDYEMYGAECADILSSEVQWNYEQDEIVRSVGVEYNASDETILVSGKGKVLGEEDVSVFKPFIHLEPTSGMDLEDAFQSAVGYVEDLERDSIV